MLAVFYLLVNSLQIAVCIHTCLYRSGTLNSKLFVSKVLLRIKWKFELTVHFKHEMLGK